MTLIARLPIVTSLFLLCCNICAAEPASHWATERQRFLGLQKQSSPSLEAIERLKHYPLYPYLLFRYHKAHLSELSPRELRHFRNHYKDSPLADRLYHSWLYHHARQKQWGPYLAAYEGSKQDALACYAVWAEYQHSHSLSQHQAEVERLWLSPSSQPKACDPVFNTWRKEGGLTRALAWERVKLAIPEEEYDLANYLGQFINRGDRQWADAWISMRKNPTTLSLDSLPAVPHGDQSFILADVLIELADSSPIQAAKRFQALSERVTFQNNDRIAIFNQLALHLSLDANPEARTWAKKIPLSERTESLQTWLVRLHLRRLEWPKVLTAISEMQPHLQSEAAWQYWRARALENTGQAHLAREIYQSLHQERSFYGFLSSEYLGKPHHLAHERLLIDPQLMIGISNLRGILRAHELMQIGETLDARREWYHTISGMGSRQKVAAARVAQRMGWYDWALFTMRQVDLKDDVPLRFPLAHYRPIAQAADTQGLPPAWIFAIARQESHFRSDARSSAGALGVMQLLPSTAMSLAKQLGISIRSQRDYLAIENNVRLGSAYLQQLLSRNPSLVVATAAYNAGPTKTLEWLPERPMPADIWIETISYAETRHYVKNVMAFYGIYNHLMGEDDQILPIMKPIARY